MSFLHRLRQGWRRGQGGGLIIIITRIKSIPSSSCTSSVIHVWWLFSILVLLFDVQLCPIPTINRAGLRNDGRRTRRSPRSTSNSCWRRQRLQNRTTRIVLDRDGHTGVKWETRHTVLFRENSTWFLPDRRDGQISHHRNSPRAIPPIHINAFYFIFPWKHPNYH